MQCLKDLKKILNPSDLSSIDLTQIEDFSGIEDFCNVKEMKLARSRISSIPFSLKSFKKLEKLNASSNILQEVPDLPKSLQELDLSNNHLTVLRFSSQFYLFELNISNNRLSSIDPLVSLSGLTHLYLSHNMISSIQSLSRLNILELDISNNLIQSYIAISPVMHSVQIIKISSNPCTKSSADSFFYSFSRSSEGLYARKKLSISSSKLVKSVVCTKTINLSKCNIVQKMTSELSVLKKKNKNLDKKVKKIEETSAILLDNDRLSEVEKMSYEDWLSSLARYQFLKSLYITGQLIKGKNTTQGPRSKQGKVNNYLY